ncbi:phosphatidylinositol-binding protein scs2 [Mortierella claussenii]|nr:phosphatidylinositol-binding protein scs2 [Mortierella claussenii]
MSIELDPSTQLSFRRPLTEAIKQTLVIRNPTQLPIAFKVKTTAPKQYCVRPNSGRVEPGQEQEVQVQMQAMKEDPPADFKCKDKFLVQSVAITAERGLLPAADLWPTVERNARDQIHEKKIRCAFLPATEHAITQIREEDEHVLHNSGSSNIGAPIRSHQQTQLHQQAEPASPIRTTQANRDSFSNPSSPSLSTAEVFNLRRELQTAQKTIQSLQSSIDKLQKDTYTLRQRKAESSASSVPSTGVAQHLNHVQEGLYPVTYVAGAAVVAFLFAYLFF